MYPTDRITHTTAFVIPVMEHWLEICLITYKLYHSYFLPSKLGVTVLFVYRLYRQLLHEPDDVRLYRQLFYIYIFFNLIGCQTVDFQLPGAIGQPLSSNPAIFFMHCTTITFFPLNPALEFCVCL